MVDVRDEDGAKGIKLFGTTISVQNHKHNTTIITHQDSTKSLSDGETLDKTTSDQNLTKSLPEVVSTDQGLTKSSSDNESLEKSPEKVVLCPRCKSMDTKFCYFNNYNVNQPRHFCKSCHRYWTAGGALREVPVGAGRRKNKPSSLSSEGFAESVLFEDSKGGQRVDFNKKVEEWKMAVVQGGFEHVFPAKRRRNISGGHSY